MSKRILFVCLATALPTWGADLTLPVAGKVSIELQYADAAFSNTMSLVLPGGAVIALNALGSPLNGCQIISGLVVGLPGIPLISEKKSQHGCRVELDADGATAGIQGFAAGAVLRFAMCAKVNAVSPGCDYIWSSNPALNTGVGSYSLEADATLDHLHITPLHNADYPDRIFQLAWEDKPSDYPSDRDFNDLVAIVRIDLDSDGDGLWDDWEQFGIDTDGDGVIDVNLPGLGANKMRKDIFVRLDYMDCAVAGGDCAMGDLHTHQPKAAAIAAVVAAFAAAPVSNPDGSTGITLHVEIGTAIKHSNTMVIPGTCMTTGIPLSDFDVEKAANFGVNNPKRFTHHYGIFAHLQDSAGHTGCAEVPGNDLLISLGAAAAGDRDGDGSNDQFVGTVLEQGGTFMHELGHNLGLQHGGGDDVNFKPNYLSVMNYAFQQSGIPLTAAPPRLDYSRLLLLKLDETSLNEAAGIGLPVGAPERTVWTCPGFTSITASAAGAINWNCAGPSTDVGFSQDINGDRVCIRPGADGIRQSALVPDDIAYLGAFIHDGPNRICDSTKLLLSDDETIRKTGDLQPQFLTGYDDWSNLIYRFQESPFFDDGDRPPSTPLVELDTRTILERTAPDPGVTADVSSIAVETGKQATYTFEVRNYSTAPVANVQLTDHLPPELSFVSCFANGGGLCGGAGSARTVTYPSLAGGDEARVTLVASLTCAAANGTVITNSATMSSPSPDSNLTNNTAALKIVALNPPPEISAIGVDQPSLSPPDNRMVLVTVNYSASDNCSVGACTLSVSSNERRQGGVPDFEVLDDHHVVLRAQSNGRDAARVYTITIECKDNAGASSKRHVTVVVPQPGN